MTERTAIHRLQGPRSCSSFTIEKVLPGTGVFRDLLKGFDAIVADLAPRTSPSAGRA